MDARTALVRSQENNSFATSHCRQMTDSNASQNLQFGPFEQMAHCDLSSSLVAAVTRLLQSSYDSASEPRCVSVSSTDELTTKLVPGSIEAPPFLKRSGVDFRGFLSAEPFLKLFSTANDRIYQQLSIGVISRLCPCHFVTRLRVFSFCHNFIRGLGFGNSADRAGRLNPVSHISGVLLTEFLGFVLCVNPSVGLFTCGLVRFLGDGCAESAFLVEAALMLLDIALLL